MIERRLEPDRLRQQHAVAENVARHVAATDDRDRLCLHVDAAFGEMTLDRNPPAARGDRHALVIVAVAAPAGEGVAEPARSEEHTSELQSLMRISYAVFCL